MQIQPVQTNQTSFRASLDTGMPDGNRTAAVQLDAQRDGFPIWSAASDLPGNPGTNGPIDAVRASTLLSAVSTFLATNPERYTGRSNAEATITLYSTGATPVAQVAATYLVNSDAARRLAAAIGVIANSPREPGMVGSGAA